MSRITFPWKPKNLVIGGGGVKGFWLPGILSVLGEFKYLDEIINVAGTSIGAVMAYLFCIGYRDPDMLKWIKYIDIKDMVNQINIAQTVEKGYLMDTIWLKKLLVELTEIRKISNPLGLTFQNLKEKTNISLHINVVSHETGKQIIFSPNNTPNDTVIDVVLMSCSIPGVFPKYFYKGEFYVDGGNLQGFLWNIFDSKETLGIQLSDGLAQSFKAFKKGSESAKEELLKTWPILKGVLNMTLNMAASLYIMLDEIDRLRLMTSPELPYKMINVKQTEVHSLSFLITNETKLDLIFEGIKLGLEFICKEMKRS